MDIFIYSDESGVFDVKHNHYFVFGGVMFLSREAKEDCARKYAKAEKNVKASGKIEPGAEAKAALISNASKGKLFRALNNQIRFGVVIDETKVHQRIWLSKKDKQRFLDYAYKIAVKRCFENLIRQGKIAPAEVQNLYFFVDEHTTATNGRYELGESLEQEFKLGTFNPEWSHFYPPIFPNLRGVHLQFCNSSTTRLVRAADIIANKIYYCAKTIEGYSANEDDLFVIRLP